MVNRNIEDDTLLRVEGLKTWFFQRNAVLKAVDGVSFTVGQGEAVGLVGESGSGKTMTCLSLMRLVPQPGARIVEGEIWFKDENLLDIAEHEMRAYRGHRMAIIMQDPQTSLNPVYSIGEQVAEPVRLHLKERGQQAMTRVLDALRAVRIPRPEQRLVQYPHQFSGGMRQRVVAAMGLTTQPELLIADEPTTSLDVTIQAQFLRLIRELAAGERHQRHLGNPRPGHRCPDVRPGECDVRRPHRGERAGAADLQGAPAPLHAGAAGLRSPDGRPPGQAVPD